MRGTNSSFLLARDIIWQLMYFADFDGMRAVPQKHFPCGLHMLANKWLERILAEGAKVTHAALESGYSTPSAFISMFRKTLGTTPTLYFKTEARDK